MTTSCVDAWRVFRSLDGGAWPRGVLTPRCPLAVPAGGQLNHRVYTTEDVHKVGPTHVPPKTLGDRAALLVLRLIRAAFDTATGYGHGMTTDKYLTRIIVLETVAGVPPMVGAMVRHTRSLRSMKRDGGWIHTLLEEAENERMHLLTFLSLRPRPSWMLRAIVLLGQGVVFNAYLAAYLLSPRVCHRFIGFLEEEAVNTYTGCIAAIDAGTLAEWRTLPAPPIAVGYWRLPDGATMRDLLLAVRADEATHREACSSSRG